MILITSAAYVSTGLASEFGKLPPCMLPVQNKRLYEHQIALFPVGEPIVLSLPKSYNLTLYDQRRLKNLGVDVVFVPDELSLGQSIVYVLNVIARYDDHLLLLHGDTLFSELPKNIDIYAVAKAEDNYEWASADDQTKMVFSGYFTFSNQSILIQKITESGYRFIPGIEAYAKIVDVKQVNIPNWLDFGLVNTYYHSISKMTTQRVFNSMIVTRYSVRKSSFDKEKMFAECNWLQTLPVSMKHYVPVIWDHGVDKTNRGFYEMEYYYLPSLANIFVFGENKTYVWKEIIDSCVKFFNEEAMYTPNDIKYVAKQNNLLYGTKTLKRLNEYSKEVGISLDTCWSINGYKTPSLRKIVEEMGTCIGESNEHFVSLMHGDPCFSNILYDFKSKSIKVIDPRGITTDGEISLYGDIRYDIAKFAHSIMGLYDYIIGGMFEYSEVGTDLSLVFESNEDLRIIQNYFMGKLFKGYTIKEMKIYPIMVLLFLSMLPLHNDNIVRQKAMLANALRLYAEFKKQ